MAKTRTESDSMGEVQVPAAAYYGASTQRAVMNFPVSGVPMPKRLLRALAILKGAAARVNAKRGRLASRLARAIERAASEVAEGRHDREFPVDVFQTGSGTSTNMNMNEVLANRANEILGHPLGLKKPVHPNDHVNLGQSSNDVFPTALHVAALEGIERDLLPALKDLRTSLAAKAKAFDRIVKIGRTHLQDAVPVRLGQEFSGYASQVADAAARIEAVRAGLSEVALGGTAVGTGLNAPPGFAAAVLSDVSRTTGIRFRPAKNLFAQLAARDACVFASGALKACAVSLAKIANDLRWLGSGPRCGLGEIALPDLQPGSSIMPGKVNPVIPEMVLQVAAQVAGNDVSVAIGGMGGHFELNMAQPLVARNLLESVAILAAASRLLDRRCVRSLRADAKRCAESVEKSLMMVTALAPSIGYDAAASVAKEAHRTGKTVREIATARNLLPAAALRRLLDARRMTGR